MSDKPHPPTERRLRRARREGQVARSRLGTGVAVVLGAAVSLRMTTPAAWLELEALLSRWLAGGAGAAEMGAPQALREAARLLIGWGGATAAGAACSGLLASALIGGVHFTPEVLQPRPDRISPAAALRRMISPRQWVEPLLAVALLLALGLLGWSRRAELLGGWHRAVRLGGARAFEEALAASLRVTTSWLTWLGLAALLAGLWARHRHLKELSMSHEEVRREHQQSEGDPHHKAQRRAMHRQLASQGPARGVAAATAVVVNPTHLAVALRYAPDEHDAPYVVAKGRDETALALRAEAGRLGIPVLKDIPLARSLIPLEPGEAIPEELYRAAAALLLLADDARNEQRRTS